VLHVQGLISEEAVLATKIHQTKMFDAFRLPLRTRITVGVEKAAMSRMTRRNMIVSNADSFVEQVSEQTFNCAVKQRSRHDHAPPAPSVGGNCNTISIARIQFPVQCILSSAHRRRCVLLS